jgi:hypothetical protein
MFFDWRGYIFEIASGMLRQEKCRRQRQNAECAGARQSAFRLIINDRRLN